jgi:hypothetical protein
MTHAQVPRDDRHGSKHSGWRYPALLAGTALATLISAQAAAVAPGNPAPAFALTTLDGKPVAPPADMVSTMESIIQDLGEIPPEYLVAAGPGLYKRNAGGEAKDADLSAKINASMPVAFGGFIGTLKGGLSARLKERDNSAVTTAYTNALGTNTLGATSATLMSALTAETQGRTLFGGDYQFGRTFDPTRMGDFITANPNAFTVNALSSATTCVAQALHQVCVGVVKAQTHNVDCFACKGNRNFNACKVLHIQGFGRSDGAFLATNFVMVCEGPELNPIGFGARSQSLRRERAIGHHGVAM